jgi:hypothetical protein
MQRFVISLLLAATVAIGVGSSAAAAPSEVSATFGPKAQFVSTSSILVPATVTCPASFGMGFVQVQVSQSATGGFGAGFTEVTCTGGPVTVVLVVPGGPFTLGQAVASGFAAAGGQFD